MNMGKSNLGFSYYIDGHIIAVKDRISDLGVTIDNKLSFAAHITTISTKARSRCALFLRSFVSRDWALMTMFFKVYVRPLMEYGCVIWSPITTSLIKKLEKVQRSFTKKAVNLRDLAYHDRLLSLQLESLQHRRRLADLIFLFSVFSGNSKMNFGSHLILKDTSNTRGHNLRIAIPYINLNTTSQTFLIRTSPDWNSLPDAALACPSTAGFRAKIGAFFRDV